MSPSSYLAHIERLYADLGHPSPLSPPRAATEQEPHLAALPADLPAWLHDLWNIADGSDDCDIFFRPDFYTGLEFLSVESAAKLYARGLAISPNYADYEDPERRDPRIREGWFRPEWVPFATFGPTIITLFADLAPAEPSGTRGQIIAFVHDADEMTFIADDWDTYSDAAWAWLASDPEDLLDLE